MINRLRFTKKALASIQKKVILRDGEKRQTRDQDGFIIEELDHQGNIRMRGKVSKV